MKRIDKMTIEELKKYDVSNVHERFRKLLEHACPDIWGLVGGHGQRILDFVTTEALAFKAGEEYDRKKYCTILRSM